jgi:hypothetical protein
MKETLPGIYHWTAPHPEIGIEVSSYFLVQDGVLIDPLVPAEGLEWFEDRKPQQIILTNRLHVRDSDQFYRRFECDIHVQRAGAAEVGSGRQVKPFGFGNHLTGGIEAMEVNSICPEETALYIPLAGGIVAFADGLVRQEDGSLGFVPDEFMAESPEQVKTVKAGLLKAFRKILENREFKHIFFAHGNPWLKGGKEALSQFVSDQE